MVAQAAPWYVVALAGWSGEDSWAWPVFIVGILLYPVTGFAIGRWWVLLLLLLPPLVVWPLGVAPDDSDGWTYAWLLIWGPMLYGSPALVVGCVVRQALRWDRGEFARHGP